MCISVGFDCSLTAVSSLGRRSVTAEAKVPAELELGGANVSVWYGGGRWAVDGDGDAEGDADVGGT